MELMSQLTLSVFSSNILSNLFLSSSFQYNKIHTIQLDRLISIIT